MRRASASDPPPVGWTLLSSLACDYLFILSRYDGLARLHWDKNDSYMGATTTAEQLARIVRSVELVPTYQMGGTPWAQPTQVLANSSRIPSYYVDNSSTINMASLESRPILCKRL